jgi:hypothetical protein
MGKFAVDLQSDMLTAQLRLTSYDTSINTTTDLARASHFNDSYEVGKIPPIIDIRLRAIENQLRSLAAASQDEAKLLEDYEEELHDELSLVHNNTAEIEETLNSLAEARHASEEEREAFTVEQLTDRIEEYIELGTKAATVVAENANNIPGVGGSITSAAKATLYIAEHASKGIAWAKKMHLSQIADYSVRMTTELSNLMKDATAEDNELLEIESLEETSHMFQMALVNSSHKCAQVVNEAVELTEHGPSWVYYLKPLIGTSAEAAIIEGLSKKARIPVSNWVPAHAVAVFIYPVTELRRWVVVVSVGDGADALQYVLKRVVGIKPTSSMFEFWYGEESRTTVDDPWDNVVMSRHGESGQLLDGAKPIASGSVNVSYHLLKGFCQIMHDKVHIPYNILKYNCQHQAKTVIEYATSGAKPNWWKSAFSRDLLLYERRGQREMGDHMRERGEEAASDFVPLKDHIANLDILMDESHLDDELLNFTYEESEVEIVHFPDKTDSFEQTVFSGDIEDFKSIGGMDVHEWIGNHVDPFKDKDKKPAPYVPIINPNLTKEHIGRGGLHYAPDETHTPYYDRYALKHAREERSHSDYFGGGFANCELL